MSAPVVTAMKQGRRRGAATRIWTDLSSNRRAMGGLLAIAAIVAVYGLLQLDDAVGSMRSTYRQRVSQVQRSLAIGEDKNWGPRAKESTALRNALEARLWQFESEGVALANLQDWVTGAGRDAGLTRLLVKIDVAHPKGLPADVRQLTATISALQNEDSLTEFLTRIEKEPHLLVVDQLHAQQAPAPLLQMIITTYVKLVSHPGAAAK